MKNYINKLIKNCVHLGHNKKLVNNEMKKNLINQNKLYLIDIEKSNFYLNFILNIFKKLKNLNKICLFVCSEKKFIKIIKLFCSHINMPYVVTRWLGGFLTNFKSIKKSLNKFKYNLNIFKKKNFLKINKKEISLIKKKIKFKRKFVTGIKNIKKLPDLIFIINPKKYKTALIEAKKMKIPTISLVDSNNSTKNVDYILPWNDDSIKSIVFLFKEITKVFDN